jgi:hypothetical protein
MSSPKRKPYKDSINQGVDEYPPLSEIELFDLLAILDTGDLFLHLGNSLRAELMLLAVQTYMDVAALTTVESITELSRPPCDLPGEFVAARWALVMDLERLLPNRRQTTSDAQEEEEE